MNPKRLCVIGLVAIFSIGLIDAILIRGSVFQDIVCVLGLFLCSMIAELTKKER